MAGPKGPFSPARALAHGPAPRRVPQPARAPTLTGVEPAARVAWIVATAQAVIEGRLSPQEGAAAVQAQQAQLTGLLRQDRDSVTRHESDAVATRLRLLAEQVSDAGSSTPDNAAHHAIARVLAELARCLR